MDCKFNIWLSITSNSGRKPALYLCSLIVLRCSKGGEGAMQFQIMTTSFSQAVSTDRRQFFSTLHEHKNIKKTFKYNPMGFIHDQIITTDMMAADSKIYRPYFHLRSPGRIIFSFPVIPINTISMRWMRPWLVQTIQVCLATQAVPPASLKRYGTVTFIRIVVLVFSWEGAPRWKEKESPAVPADKWIR